MHSNLSAMTESDLTICTVSYYHKDHLRLNRQFTNSLNPTTSFKWIVTENTPDPASCINSTDNDFLIIKGPRKENFKDVIESYHHAAGLQMACEQIQSRFALFLDPDFYIVSKNWITEILSYMKKHELSFFGAPWHPKWYVKYRYFPCVHCLFVDLQKVPKLKLDFTPDCEPPRLSSVNHSTPYTLLKRNIPSQIQKIIRALRPLSLKSRQFIGQEKDTGYPIFNTFYHKEGSNYECVTPVFRPRSDFRNTTPFWLNASLEKVLPDSLSYIPKKKESYSEIGFRELGYTDVSSKQWEEFLWKGKPFGFHIRGNPKRATRNLKDELSTLVKVHQSFL